MAELSPDLHSDLQAVAESLADSVAVVAAKTMQARGLAAELEAELAVCRAHLNTVLPLVNTTWAHDTAAVEAAQEYLDRDVYE